LDLSIAPRCTERVQCVYGLTPREGAPPPNRCHFTPLDVSVNISTSKQEVLLLCAPCGWSTSVLGRVGDQAETDRQGAGQCQQGKAGRETREITTRETATREIRHSRIANASRRSAPRRLSASAWGCPRSARHEPCHV